MKLKIVDRCMASIWVLSGVFKKYVYLANASTKMTNIHIENSYE